MGSPTALLYTLRCSSRVTVRRCRFGEWTFILRPNEIRNRYGSILIRNSRPQTEYKERDFLNTQVPELDKVSTCVTNKLSKKKKWIHSKDKGGKTKQELKNPRISAAHYLTFPEVYIHMTIAKEERLSRETNVAWNGVQLQPDLNCKRRMMTRPAAAEKEKPKSFRVCWHFHLYLSRILTWRFWPTTT